MNAMQGPQASSNQVEFQRRRECCCLGFNSLTGTALLIIGSTGVAGFLSPTSMGAYSIGLAIPFAITSLFSGTKDCRGRSRKFDFLIDIILGISVGILGCFSIANKISQLAMGLSIIVPAFAYLGLKIICCRC